MCDSFRLCVANVLAWLLKEIEKIIHLYITHIVLYLSVRITEPQIVKQICTILANDTPVSILGLTVW